MNKDFIPYEQALELRQLGFNEQCFSFYDSDGQLYESEGYYKQGYNVLGEEIIAPLYQQAFRWFREKYNLREQYGVFPHHTIMMNYLIEGGREEEAELACLNKLIEIVKQ